MALPPGWNAGDFVVRGETRSGQLRMWTSVAPPLLKIEARGEIEIGDTVEAAGSRWIVGALEHRATGMWIAECDPEGAA